MWGSVGCDQGLRGGEVRKLLKILATSAVLMMFSTSVAMAQEVVKDQENPGPINNAQGVNNGGVQAQIITTEKGGQLSSASFYLMRESSTSEPLCADLWSVVEGNQPQELQQPLGCVNASDVPANNGGSVDDVFGWVEIQFQSTPYMSPGSKYAIVLHSKDRGDIGGYFVGATSANPSSDGTCPIDGYLGGQLRNAGSGYPVVGWHPADETKCQDLMFTTYNTVDTTAPTANILINGGAYRTDTRLVTLSLSATDPEPSSGVTQMRFKNERADAVWSDWKPYAETKNWYLSAGEGKKRVAVQYRDAAGNRFATAYDYIVFRRSR
jgi:hypothetical protein